MLNDGLGTYVIIEREDENLNKELIFNALNIICSTLNVQVKSNVSFYLINSNKNSDYYSNHLTIENTDIFTILSSLIEKEIKRRTDILKSKVIINIQGIDMDINDITDSVDNEPLISAHLRYIGKTEDYKVEYLYEKDKLINSIKNDDHKYRKDALLYDKILNLNYFEDYINLFKIIDKAEILYIILDEQIKEDINTASKEYMHIAYIDKIVFMCSYEVDLRCLRYVIDNFNLLKTKVKVELKRKFTSKYEIAIKNIFDKHYKNKVNKFWFEFISDGAGITSEYYLLTLKYFVQNISLSKSINFSILNNLELLQGYDTPNDMLVLALMENQKYINKTIKIDVNVTKNSNEEYKELLRNNTMLKNNICMMEEAGDE
jgi:hypothetical protein